MESNAPYHKVEFLTPNYPTSLKKLASLEEEEEEGPKQSFNKVIRQAKQNYYKTGVPDPVKAEDVDDMKLEDIINPNQNSETNIPWPPIRQWVPELIRTPKLIFKCFLGGIIIALITVPPSMAYCTMVDFPVKFGLNSNTIALVVYSIFGTSKQMSIGPLAMTYFIMAQSIYSLDTSMEVKINLARTMTFLMGLFMILMGCMKMTFIENVFSEPIIFGFLQASGFLIVFEQLSKMGQIKFHGKIWEKFYQLYQQFDQINWISFLIGAIGVILFFINHFIRSRYFPNSVFLLSMPFIIPAIGALISYLYDFPTLYGIEIAKNIPAGLPDFDVPPLSFYYIMETWGDALKICLVSFTTSLLLTKQLGKKYNYETSVPYEFLALGLANFIGSFFSSLPTFGALGKSPIIELTGANNQLAGMVTGIMVIVESICLAEVFRLMPITIINGYVLFVCSLIFGELKIVKFWAKHFKTDFIFFLITFFLGLIVGLVDGLIVSLLISLIYILKTSSRPIWSFRTFESDEENTKNIDIGGNINRKNTLLLADTLSDDDGEVFSNNFDFKKSWIYNLKKNTASVNYGVLKGLNIPKKSKKNSTNLTADDICLCHKWSCIRKCHIVVISLHGNLTYVNIKGLKEQAEFLTIGFEGKINKNVKRSLRKRGTIYDSIDDNLDLLIQNPLKYENMELKMSIDNDFVMEFDSPKGSRWAISNEERKSSIRGIIFECSKLFEVDYTSLNALKAMTEDFTKRNKKIWVKFSEMQNDMKIKFKLFKFNRKCLDLSSFNTMAVLYKCCLDILKSNSN